MCFALFGTFFMIGIFTFGGGYAMLPLIQSEVLSRGWMSGAELVNFIAVSESTPGPFAVNISTYIGTSMDGVPGAFCATIGVVLPSFLIILLVARFYERFQKNCIVSGCMNGLRPAVIGLMGAAVVSVGQAALLPEGYAVQSFLTPSFLLSAAIFCCMTVLSFKKVHPILVICLSAAIGIGAGYALGIPV